ncbi:hypothetical protein SEA_CALLINALLBARBZ_4 [Arthrobacter phage CallinAllBarbz]|uniref:MuF-like minor capsid protein n=1 Tax=Arthrobacter phage CallinAllBarbz TaxID=3077790 RepID=A0AA96KAE8_9CAUD|nr:hypothetical protein SEA_CALLINALLBARBZ_4 [Arthrobacter phage CallinAllBarbz]
MATNTLLRNYRRSTGDLAALVEDEVERFWKTLDPSDARATSKALQAFLVELVQDYGDIAAVLAGDYYDALMEEYRHGAREAILADVTPEEEIRISVRAGVHPLFGANPDTALALGLVAAGAVRLALQPGRSTIDANTRRDGLLYARIPTGRDTCAFCLYMAALGPIFGKVEIEDGNKYHDKCYCVPTPMRGPEDAPKDYDLKGLSQTLAAHDKGDPKQTRAALRESLNVK